MRRYYLDNIRWITVLLVALYHVFFIFNSVIPDIGMPFAERQYQDAVLYILHPWFMVLLFIVAGMSSRYYLEKHTVREFVRSRTRKLLVPSTIGLLVLGWIQGYVSIAISGAFETLSHIVPAPIMYFIMVLSGISVLWFIQMLWLFSMLLALGKRFEKGKLYDLTGKANVAVMILLVIPVWLSGLVLNMPVITVYRFGIYTFSYFLGYFVFAHDEVIDRISKWKYVFIPAAVILGIVYVVLHFGDNYAAMPVVGSISAVGFAWAAILAVFGSAKAWGDRTDFFTEFMRKRSWGIYIFHYLVMSATAYLLRIHTDLGALPCYLITGVAAFLGGLLLYEILSRVPILRWCTLGIKREKSNVQG